MQTSRLTTIVAAAASAVSAPVAAAVAAPWASAVAAAPAASVPHAAPLGAFILRIEPLTTGATKTVTLTCEPTGGTHPDGDATCGDLIAADGDISRIPQAPAFCPFIFKPVIASAHGIWRGRPVGYRKRFGNAECANVATGGHVFHF